MITTYQGGSRAINGWAKARRAAACISAAFAVILALALSPAAKVQAASDDGRMDRIDAFIKVMGFDVMLESMVISARNAPNMLGMNAKGFGKAWTLQVDQIFAPGGLNAEAREILGATIPDEELNHAAAFYASDLGQRLVVAENEAHMKGGSATLDRGQEIVAKLLAEGSPRLEYFSRLMLATGLEDTAVRSVVELRVRFLTAASDAGITRDRLDPDRLRAQMMAQQGKLRRAIKLQTLATSAYTYRDFSDEEVLAYAEELESPQMRRVYELLNAVQFELAAERYEKIARRLADMQPPQDL